MTKFSVREMQRRFSILPTLEHHYLQFAHGKLSAENQKIRKAAKALLILLFLASFIYASQPLQAQAQATYSYTFTGPFYDGGDIANANVSLALLYVNSTIYRFDMAANGTHYNTTTIISTTAASQVLWNASTALNQTRIIDFIGSTEENITVFIPSPQVPSYYYQFTVSDIGANMENPFLQSSINVNSTHSFVVERRNLTTVSAPTFIMSQYGTYTLSVVCDQGTYSQSFTAENTYNIEIPVLAGVFPFSNSTLPTFQAIRYNETAIAMEYYDGTNSTSNLYILITHKSGQTDITDYVSNTAGHSQSIVWNDALESKAYLVLAVATISGSNSTWRISVAKTASSNVWEGSFDWLGVDTKTLPYVYTGWGGFTSAQISQFVAMGLMILFLGIGSFRNAGASMFMAFCFGGIMLAIGWYNGGAVVAGASSIPLFGLGGVLAVLIHLGENRKHE